MSQNGKLLLSTGESMEGQLIGAPLSASGELVFCTGMVGYSEAITDPSYFGQILIFSYPLIGNYGFPEMTAPASTNIPIGFESAKARAAGIILSQESLSAHHWNSIETLDSWLKQQKIPALSGIDTRHLIHILRNRRNNNEKILARIEPENFKKINPEKNTFFDPDQTNILPKVSTSQIIKLGKGRTKIAIYDFGVKWNIIRKLIKQNCEIEILPWNTPPETIDCNGWLFSNGPGDPLQTEDTIQRIQKIIKKKQPILGICLGHQLLALAAGAQTRKMNYGHRSQNQPVIEISTQRAFMTTQNHGFEVKKESLPPEWELWFTNANDHSVEGICHQTLPFKGVQFHPEASGGPHDTEWVIDDFISDAKKSK